MLPVLVTADREADDWLVNAKDTFYSSLARWVRMDVRGVSALCKVLDNWEIQVARRISAHLVPFSLKGANLLVPEAVFRAHRLAH